MKKTNFCQKFLFGIPLVAVLLLAAPRHGAAHCDTLDGPVVQDARKAVATREITPVLKWIKPKDEKTVRAAFKKMLAERTKNPEAAEQKFFSTLVKIHRAGEGAPFTGLKPADAIEPAVAEADRALASGSADALVKLVADNVAEGIAARYKRAAEAYKHKDESVAQGREFVEAYVAYTHYVERLNQDATGRGAHGEHSGQGVVEKHGARKTGHAHH